MPTLTRRELLAAGTAGAVLATARPASAEERPLRICLISGSALYRSEESLSELQAFLEKRGLARCSRAFGKDRGTDLPGLEALEDAEVMLVFARRLTLPQEQLGRIKSYCAAGKPVVGVRTASHAFQNWLEFDREVLGGSYKGHFPDGPVTQVRIEEKVQPHPILAGVRPFTSIGSLYQNPTLSPDATLLLTGSIPGNTEPVAWTRTHNGGRVFYTSLGHPDDFKNDHFHRMLVNALFWAAGRRSPL